MSDVSLQVSLGVLSKASYTPCWVGLRFLGIYCPSGRVFFVHVLSFLPDCFSHSFSWWRLPFFLRRKISKSPGFVGDFITTEVLSDRRSGISRERFVSVGFGDVLHLSLVLVVKYWKSLDMDVCKNSGTRKSSIWIWFSIVNHPFWGTTICGNTHMILFQIGEIRIIYCSQPGFRIAVHGLYHLRNMTSFLPAVDNAINQQTTNNRQQTICNKQQTTNNTHTHNTQQATDN